MRVAIVHDWFVTYAGSERVVEQLLAMFPSADVFSLLECLGAADRDFLAGKKVTTSFLQRLPFVERKYGNYLPLMPLAIEQLDLSRYDLVISSSHCVAKGVLTGPDQLHISYVHTPMRYAWDVQHEYLAGAGLDRGIKGWLTRWMLHKLRLWDVRTAHGVDSFVANSQFIARRIWKAYRRQSRVIYPPVDVEAFPLCEDREDFYVTASRLVPYKRVDVLVEAFGQLPDKQLVVIGDGPELKKLRAQAGPNVTLLGYQSDAVLRDYIQRARAFLFASREDFGIVPVEAQATGAPVIAFGEGGALETIRGLDSPRPTGVFFAEQTPAAVVEAVETFEREGACIKSTDCRENATRFSVERFHREFFEHAMDQWDRFRSLEFRRQPRQAGSPESPADVRPHWPLRAA
ncbi:MAG: glycosyltransferase family 4 protein [Planctomycetia bacterium]|nr:glycosyltransferase family 4 protein [Planctomycetia bacterium]